MMTLLNEDDVEEITLLSLEMRFSDGEVRKLNGVDAQEWFTAVNARDIFCDLHGFKFPAKIKWDIQR